MVALLEVFEDFLIEGPHGVHASNLSGGAICGRAIDMLLNLHNCVGLLEFCEHEMLCRSRHYVLRFFIIYSRCTKNIFAIIL